jgi:proteasome accessory factor A
VADGARVRPRIFCIATEYGLTCKTEDRWGLDSPTLPTVIGHLFEASELRSTNIFLEDGARLYLDMGTHPEYAEGARAWGRLRWGTD